MSWEEDHDSALGSGTLDGWREDPPVRGLAFVTGLNFGPPFSGTAELNRPYGIIELHDTYELLLTWLSLWNRMYTEFSCSSRDLHLNFDKLLGVDRSVLDVCGCSSCQILNMIRPLTSESRTTSLFRHASCDNSSRWRPLRLGKWKI